MRLTREVDYALRIMRCLAENPTANNGVSATVISETIHVPIRFTQKILRKLSGSDMVHSYKGAGGGYSLTRPSSQITLLEVVEAVDGPMAISPCLCADFECTHSGDQIEQCFYHRVFCEVNRKIAEMLSKITLDAAAEDRCCEITNLLNQ